MQNAQQERNYNANTHKSTAPPLMINKRIAPQEPLYFTKDKNFTFRATTSLIFKQLAFGGISFGLSILVIYYNYSDIANLRGEPVLQNWNYFQTAAFLSIFTITLGQSKLLHKSFDSMMGDSGDDTKAIIQILLWSWVIDFLAIFLYPGREELKLSSDPELLNTIVWLGVIQGVFFYFIAYLKRKFKHKM